jgi:hypothetical protein
MDRPMPLRSLLRILPLLATSVAWGVQAQPGGTSPDRPVEAMARPAVVLLLPAQSTGFAQPAEALRQRWHRRASVASGWSSARCRARP